MQEMTAEGIQHDRVTCKCVIEVLHAASEHEQAEELYVKMLERGF
jgi:pentatricopeptide repeat protein